MTTREAAFLLPEHAWGVWLPASGRDSCAGTRPSQGRDRPDVARSPVPRGFLIGLRNFAIQSSSRRLVQAIREMKSAQLLIEVFDCPARRN